MASEGLGCDVTRQNYWQQLPRIKAALQSCSFFAVDLEMTGLFLDHHRNEFFDEPQDRYSRLREAAGAYQITQFGLSCFAPVEGGYEATTFNAYIFPEPLTTEVAAGLQPRRFLSDASALSFLATHAFDFNKWIREGVPYMPLRVHEDMVRQAARAERREQPRSEVVVDKPADREWLEQLLAQVCDWLESEEPELLLPKMSSWQRLLGYQELARPRNWAEGGSALPLGSPAQDPGFYLTKVDVGGWLHIRLVRGSAAEAAAAEAARKAQLATLLNQAAGFSEVMRAMRDSGKPCVFHNGLFDVVYVLATFAHGLALPPLWEDFKGLVGHWFPGGVYDTKYLCRDIDPAILPGGTALADVFTALTQEGAPRDAARALVVRAHSSGRVDVAGLPAIRHAPGSTKYRGTDAGAAAHEAGYDAFMTGAVFSRLVPVLAATEQLAAATSAAPAAGLPQAAGVGQAAVSAVRHLCGRFNLSYTDLPYLSLVGADPPLQRSHVVHVSGGPPGARQSDLTTALTAAGLPGRPRVTALPPGSTGGLGGFLVEMEQAACADWSAARLARALAAVAALAAAGNGGSSAAWQVQEYAAYAEAKKQLLQDSQQGGGQRERRDGEGPALLAGAKRRRMDEAAAQPGAQAEPGEPMVRGNKCVVM